LKFAKVIGIGLLGLVSVACPKRQTMVHLAYVQSPPAPTPSEARQGGVWVIEKPAPPQPAVAPARPKRAPTVQVRPPVEHPHVVHKTEPETAPQNPGPTPQLEPLSSEQQQDALRYRINALQKGIERRIDSLTRRALSVVDQKAVSDARVLLGQSRAAMDAGDLTQSLNLAKKADLLVAAVEKGT
jgi:hypothetical protein